MLGARPCEVAGQHKLEEALLFSGQFMDVLQALVDWLYKVEPQLAEDQPVHGDLDLVMNLMDAHKGAQHGLAVVAHLLEQRGQTHLGRCPGACKSQVVGRSGRSGLNRSDALPTKAGPLGPTAGGSKTQDPQPGNATKGSHAPQEVQIPAFPGKFVHHPPAVASRCCHHRRYQPQPKAPSRGGRFRGLGPTSTRREGAKGADARRVSAPRPVRRNARRGLSGSRLPASAPLFMLDLYHAMAGDDDEDGGRSERGLGRADLVMSFVNMVELDHTLDPQEPHWKEFRFDLTQIPAGEVVTATELRIYKLPSLHQSNKTLHISMFAVVEEQSNRESDLFFLDLQILRVGDEGWLVMDITVISDHWLLNSNKDLGLTRAQHGSRPGWAAGATDATLQTAFHGHFLQGKPKSHLSSLGSETPEEEATEEN
ncbi:uncharacterized protein LOC119514206 [Choloepus didactylus]|uniref:uncharacterized protein LOC119514206 n=1 Tax=Choloepus didactylus TaxID=27675 RepID=UPI00189ECFFE|nr:uncharacterized protein LOC119514206 [Choloepus didactylus]